MSNSCELLVMGGSAGSFDVLIKALPKLHVTNQFAIVIVVHRNKDPQTVLADLFASKTKLTVKEPEEKEEILPDTIYLAPADYHLLIEKDKTFSLDYSEKINFSRPCIDATFQTAAEAFGDKLVGVLLSGSNADGVEGLKTIKTLGGLTAVQSPESCEIPYMTQQALSHVDIDKVIDGNNLASFIKNL